MGHADRTGPAFSPGSRATSGPTALCGSYSSNGSWWLGGSELVVAGSPNTVSASARCSGVYSFTGDRTWSQGQDATPMGSIYGRSYFLAHTSTVYCAATASRSEGVLGQHDNVTGVGGSSAGDRGKRQGQVRRLWAATPSSTAITAYTG